MVKGSNTAMTAKKFHQRMKEFRRIFKVMFSRPVVTLGVFIIVFVIMIAIFSPLIAPYNPNQQNLGISLQKPSKQHLLGTDELGRDQLSRIMYGTRIALMVGVVAVSFASVAGMGMGLVAGYFGGWVGTIIMRFVDALMAFPPIILILAIATILGANIFNVMVAVAVGMLPTYCRLIYSEILSVRENDYVLASISLGSANLRIMFHHILPNVFPSLIVLITINIGVAILSESYLSFLGVGINPPTATWGNLVSGGYGYLMSNPMLALAPGIAILLLVLAFNLLGDGLRDALDPRLRGTI
jgi:ABC-type dipeptide/oligopeptide/nickel transport system permease subunit